MTSRHFIRAASALALGIAALGGLTAPAMLNAQPVAAAKQPVLLMSVGGSQVVNLPARMSDVVIADPSVVDVHVRSQNQLYLLAKKPGETTIFVTAPNGKVLYSANVQVGNNLTSIDQMLRLAMPEADVQVSTMNGMILLTGTIKDPEDAAEAEKLTQAFVGKDVNVVSRLRTATPLQVTLQVKISEVNRSLLHKVGTNITGLGTGVGSFSGYLARDTRGFGNFGDQLGGSSPNINRGFVFEQPTDSSTTVGFLAKLFGANVAGALDLAENAGLATSLAQPTLTALSGETASFLAGGEYPYTVSNGTQGNSIEFKQYGVQLSFTPTVLADGRISLRVRPTVSTLDFSINSSTPALKTRTAETTVEMGSGQGFMLAGLLNGDNANNVNKVPFFGDIPILGSLFKSRQFQRNETELVIVVTPYLVRPVNASAISLPTDGFRSATQAQGLLLQRGSDGISGEVPPRPTYVPSSEAALPPTPGGTANSGRRRDGSKPAPGFSF